MTSGNTVRIKKTTLTMRFGQLAFIFGLIFLLNANAHAQTIGGPGDDPDAPIDGGISLLVAAGVAYGAKQWADARKAKNKSGDGQL